MKNYYMILIAASLMSFTVPEVQPPQGHLHGIAERCAVQKEHVLVLYYTTYCPYSVKVLRYLEKIHKTIPMKNLDKDPEGKAELRRFGGKMQVPCLFIDGKPLYESDQIIRWLSQHQEELEPT